MKIAVVGLGKIGSCLLACLAEKGYNVIGIDLNNEIVEKINHGITPYPETGLQLMIQQNRERITATTNIVNAIPQTDIAFIRVATPSNPDGSFSSEYVETAVLEIARSIPNKKKNYTIVNTSTVMPGTMNNIYDSVKQIRSDIGLCYLPDWVALGSVIYNIMNPDLILLGESDKKAGDEITSIIGRLVASPTCHAKIHRMNFVNAETSKLLNNNYISMKISFANTVMEYCERIQDGDAKLVLDAIGEDSRIGKKFMRPGLGYGGFCVTPDTDILTMTGIEKIKDVNTNLISDENDNIQVIKEKMCRKYDGELIGIKPKGYEFVYLSPEHPIFVDNTQRKNWGDNSGLDIRKRDKEFKGFKQAKDIKQGDILKIPHIKREISDLYGIYPYSNEFLEYMGWYVAEGFTEIDKKGKCRISLNVKEKEAAEEINRLAKGFSPLNNYQKRLYQVRIYNKQLTLMFIEWFGIHAKNKKLPTWIMQLTKDRLKYFLRGFFKGDGCHQKNRLTFSSSSEQLIKQLWYLFNSLGYYPFLNYTQSSEKEYKGYKWKSQMYNIRFSPDDSKELENYLEITNKSDGGLHRNTILKTEDAFYVPVYKINKKQYSGLLYNFETETEKYCCPFVVHNCFPRDQKAFIHDAINKGIKPMLHNAADKINDNVATRIALKLNRIMQQEQTNKIAFLGYTYKPDTVYTEESTVVKIINLLENNIDELDIQLYDPAYQLADNPDSKLWIGGTYAPTLKDCIKDQRIVFIGTPWKQFLDIKPELFKGKIVIDSTGLLQELLENESDVNYIRVGTDKFNWEP